MRAVLMVGLLASTSAFAQLTFTQPARSNNIEVKLGPYLPEIDSEKGLQGHPWADTFGGSALLGELEFDHYFWQKYGAAGAGVSLGYAEKYGEALAPDGSVTGVRTNFKSIPIRVLGLYRLDYFALNSGIPLVPYLKAGFVYNPWYSGKGTAAVDYPEGVRAAGSRWGLELAVGLAFQMDILEPRLAHDFYSDLGVAHTYLFADFTDAWVDDLGSPGLDLSSKHWMFGLSFEY